jgi:hypothetical protein
MAEEYKLIAEELEKAAGHYRVTAKHYFERNIPSACAHALAGAGHVSKAQRRIDECVEIH